MKITEKLLFRVIGRAREKGAAVFKIDCFTKGDKFKTLVFTMLSARTKDETTLKVCERLFSEINSVREMAKASVPKLERLIYGVGFYRTKAKHLSLMAKMLVSEFAGKVPSDFDSLLKLPGVGRKTANVVLAHAFGKDAIGVDVHVHRISNRLGIVRTRKPEDTENELKKIIPKSLWKLVNIAFVSHGQTTCLPRKPLCGECAIRRQCKKIGVQI